MESVKISEIIIDYDHNCSRPLCDELVKSISQFGIIDALLCINTEDGCLLLDGYNRYEVSRRLGLVTVPVIRLMQFDYELWCRCITKKTVSGTISQAGLFRAAAIVDRYAPEKSNDFGMLFLRGIEDRARISQIIIKNENLFRFLNAKRASAKFIRQLAGQELPCIGVLSAILDMADVSFGTFRNLCDMVGDIYRRDSSVPLIAEKEDRKALTENEIYEYYFALRYPLFSERREQFGNIQQSLHNAGFSALCPQNFEGNYIDLVYRVSAKDSNSKIENSFKKIPAILDSIRTFLQ